MKKGSKQVAIVREEEKCAFTLLVSVVSDGTLLPFQTIHQGKTIKSVPNPKAVGFHFEYSSTDTYWSTQETM